MTNTWLVLLVENLSLFLGVSGLLKKLLDNVGFWIVSVWESYFGLENKFLLNPADDLT